MHALSPFAAALALCLAGQAHAAIVTYSFADTFSGTNGFDRQLTRFSPSLGTLTAITLRVDGEVTSGVWVEDVVNGGDPVFFRGLDLSFPGGIELSEDGPFDLSFQVTSFQDYVGDTPFVFSGANSGAGNYRARVTYTYDERIAAVPVPASLPLVGLGLAALGWVRARRLAAV